MKIENTKQAWDGFKTGKWTESVDVLDFIKLNYTPYEGDDSFLAPATERTNALWKKVLVLMKKEIEKNGCLDADVSTPSAIDSHKAGYIDKDAELIVGLQTDAPLKRAIMPCGGYRMVHSSCEAYGLKEDERVKEIFTKYRKTHNQGVFDAYTPDIKTARHSAIITGLPDAYGRGRIIGDYRRLALYGIDILIEDKKREKAETDDALMTAEVIREREELAEQIEALEAIRRMASFYGIDISKPATNFREAVQWTYFAYLAAVKDQNGAAMSLGRTTSFLDIYAERDLARGVLDESAVQEIVDDFVIKLRMVRFLRTPEYNDLFSGDPVWVTESLGGMNDDGRTFVTKNSFRMLHTLSNLGPAPEPNLTVLWSAKLPDPFKAFCAKTSIATSAIQYENDDLMRPAFGDDYGIACCVSPMIIGKEMQFFGARANLAKALLYAINGGVDERTGALVAKGMTPITSEYLDYDEVCQKLDKMMDWLSRTYVNALNIIHFMHDKYYYEKAQLAFMQKDVVRKLGCGIAGFSVVTDSLSAIKYAKVKAIRNEQGIAVALAKSMTPQLRGTAKRVDGKSAESFNASVGRMLIGVSLDKQRRFSAAVAKIMYDAEQKKLTETDVAKMLDGKTVDEVIDFAAPIKTPFPTNESEEFYLTPVSKEELRARKIIPAEDEAPQPYSKSLVPTSAK